MKDRKLKMSEMNVAPTSVIIHSENCDEDSYVYTDAYHGNHFLKKLQNLYQQELLCDVQLVVEKQTIETHKSVLAANSPYFEVMFLSNMLEKDQKHIQIKGISYTILKSLIDFCYTASVKVNMENALDLLSAADMLQFEGIKQCCSTYLQTKLDVNNCLNIASFAELHTCYTLKESAEDYSKANFRDVKNCEEFLHLSIDQLKAILSNDSISVVSEKDVFEAVVKWIKFNETERKQDFEELLKLVRLQHLPAKLVVDCIECHPYIQESRSCLKLINNIKNHQLLPIHRQKSTNDYEIKSRSLHSESKIYMIGGETRDEVFDSLDCYSFQHLKWSQVSRMSKPRDGLGVATYDGSIYVAGGYNGKDALNSCECYTPETNTWQAISPMNYKRHAFSMTELNGWLYAAGGSDFVSTEYNSAEAYDPIRDEWIDITCMSSKREGLVLVANDNALYAIGGENGVSILNTIERYDPRTGVWYNCTSMGYRRRYFGAVSLNEKIYSIGGSDYEEDLNTVELFEARYNRWIPIPSMNERRESVAVVAIDNRIFALGGACVNKETDTAECYDPSLNRWEEFGAIPRAKEGMGAVGL